MFGPNLSDLEHLHQPMFVIEPAPQVRRGWRAFKCEDCDLLFALPTRDHASPSRDQCPYCKESEPAPFRSWPDHELRVDEHGNLVNGGL